MAARADQRAASGQARRDHRDQDADLAPDGDRLPPRHRPAQRSRATSSSRFVCTYNGEEIFRAELFPAIAANPFIAFFDRRDARAARSPSRWTGDNGFAVRPRRRRSRSNERRASDSARLRAWPARLLRCRCRGVAAEIRARRAPLRLRRHEPRDARRCRTTTPPIPACCGCSTARRCGTRKAGAAEQRLRRLPWRRRDQHEGRRRALSGLRRRARGAPGRSRAAHQPLPHRAPAGARPLAVREPASCWR